MSKLFHPYESLSGGHWLSGNLHSHSNRSDGKRTPQQVIDVYAALGHHFLALSDHDKHAGPAEYAALDARGLVLLPGNEVTARGPHLLHIGGTRTVAPGADRQLVVDEAVRDGGFVVANHPQWWFNHFPLQALRALSGYTHLEIYNGSIERDEGSPYALSEWDILLSEGRRLWGVATDDSHWEIDDGLGWCVVYANERTPAAVLQALQAGRFYASTGVTISNIEVEGQHIRVTAPDASRIVALRELGKRFHYVDGSTLEVEYPAGAPYVRFECYGSGQKIAWTQPFWSAEQ